jgi:hypothetical protein
MTVEEKAGQVLMPSYGGTDFEAQAATIERLHLAGSIIMGDNIPLNAQNQVDTAAMAAVNARLAQATRADGRAWSGLIGVDQEGGVVARLGAPLTEWPAPMSYGAAGSEPLAKDAGRALATELAPLGFNLDFAPDTDVTIGPADPTIGARSMSGDPDSAARLGVAFSQGMQEAGILPVVKHFPGHGSVTVDSHQSLPVQPAGVAELGARDWKPFQVAVAAGAPMVMTGHIAVPALEPGVPASLSRPTYAALRGMGFNGVAVTDALNMGAIQQQFPGGAAAPAALAGSSAGRSRPAGCHDDDLAWQDNTATWLGAGKRKPALRPGFRGRRHSAVRSVQRPHGPGERPPGRRLPTGQGPVRGRSFTGRAGTGRRAAGQPHRLRRRPGGRRHRRRPGRPVAAAGLHSTGQGGGVRPEPGGV